MGIANLDDGSIEHADLDGGNPMVIVSQGVTHTPMRANLDGSRVQMLVETYWRTALRSSQAGVGK